MKICHALIHSNNYGKNDFVGVPRYFGKSSSHQNWEELVCVLKEMLYLEKNK